VTPDNPAIPGETLTMFTTGLGLPTIPDEFIGLISTGHKCPEGGPNTVPVSFVSAIAGGKTADVLSATIAPGQVETFLVLIHLNSDIPTNTATEITIAQDNFVSNVVTFPVLNPAPPQ
jgi:uncharacterized protein (TIGR03437 family)